MYVYPIHPISYHTMHYRGYTLNKSIFHSYPLEKRLATFPSLCCVRSWLGQSLGQTHATLRVLPRDQGQSSKNGRSFCHSATLSSLPQHWPTGCHHFRTLT